MSSSILDQQDEKTTVNKLNVSLSFAKKKHKGSLSRSKDSEEKNSIGSKNIADIFGNNVDENTRFGAAAAQFETEKREREGIKLVIPVNHIGDKNQPLLSGLKRIVSGYNDKVKSSDKGALKSSSSLSDLATEQEAEAALIASASEHNRSQVNTNEGTNFSATSSSLVIQNRIYEENQLEKNLQTYQSRSEDDDIKYKRDLEHRADDIAVDSESYVTVPISEFGAAMLRGMGWTGENEQDKQNTKDFVPRPHRLGLGATKLPSSLSEVGSSGYVSGSGTKKRHYAKKGGTVADREHINRQEEEERKWKLHLDEKRKLDMQITLQIGSIVRILREDGKIGKNRAKLIKIAGVPGLNRVLIRYEFDSDNTAVKKSNLVLVDRNELDESPFQDAIDSEKKKIPTSDQYFSDSCNRKKEEQNGESLIKKPSKRSHSQSFDEQLRKTSSTDFHQLSKEYQSRKREKRDEQSRDYKKESEKLWLTPNIRVRIISKKIGSGKYFKEKGIVVDVMARGAEATVHLDNGRIVERVPERYLETSIPKIGGNVIILVGKHRYEKGQLIERNSEKGKGSIQLFEDMNVVTLSLDDIAEWCGPLDDTIREDE